MRRITTRAMMLIVLAGAGIAGNASAQALNAYLTFANTNTKVELMATAWGRSDELRRGEHVQGLSRTRTTTLSVLLDARTFPIVSDGGWLDLRQSVTLTLSDAELDRVYRLTGVSDLACDAPSRICSFDFLKVEGLEAER